MLPFLSKAKHGDTARAVSDVQLKFDNNLLVFIRVVAESKSTFSRDQ